MRPSAIRTRTRRHSLSDLGAELPLTSLMDVLVILVVFLLKQETAAPPPFSPVPGLELPLSQSQKHPIPEVLIQLTPEALFFEQERLGAIEAIAQWGPLLQARLRQQPAVSRVALQVDRRVHYGALRPVLEKTFEAGCPIFHLVGKSQASES